MDNSLFLTDFSQATNRDLFGDIYQKYQLDRINMVSNYPPLAPQPSNAFENQEIPI